MAVKKFNQWTLQGTIGKTGIKLSRYGCYICSILSGWSRLYPSGRLTPEETAKTWDFTKDGLLKYSTDFDGMKIVKNSNGSPIFNGEPNNDDLAYWVRSKDRFMVLQLNGGAHFVFIYYYPFSIGINGTVIIDSNGGKIRPFWKSGYRCTGYRLFERE